MRKRIGLSCFVTLILLCLGAFVFESQTRVVRRVIDDLVYDNRDHYLPCEKLPIENEVREVVAAHQGTIRQIEQVNPDLVGVEIDASTCPGKADLLIWYTSHQNRQAIEELIAGETFYSVPYRLQNR